MSLLDYKAMYVNLASRTDRNEHMKVQLRKAKIKAERFDAKKPGDWKGDTRKIQSMLNRTPGAIGCYISQISVIRKIVDEGFHAMVLEDDVLFCDDFEDRLLIAADFLDARDWAILWLGGTCHTDSTWAKENGTQVDMKATDHPHMVRTYGAFSTHGYIVNKDRADEVISRLAAGMHRHWGIDHGMILDVQPHMPCYAFIPGALYQMDGQSNIGNGVTQFSHFRKFLGNYCWEPGHRDNFKGLNDFMGKLLKE